MFPVEKAAIPASQLLPVPAANQPIRRKGRAWVLVKLLFIGAILLQLAHIHLPRLPLRVNKPISPNSFFWTRNDASSICPGVHGNKSFSGYIALKGETEDKPRRSFYWLFEAQRGAENAPVILTHGGGPVTANGVEPNPNAWTEHFNLLALDHPIGAGFSYGEMVNNSRAAAHDIYDFLQKFYVLYPHLAKNPLVLASGSYGGVYVPHTATVINEHNKELAAGRGPRGAQHLNLESLMISNPLSDAFSWFSWKLYQACTVTDLYNATQCAEYHELLPQCLEDVLYAYENNSADNRYAALETCTNALFTGDTHGRATDNIKHKCDSDPVTCSPEFGVAVDLLNSESTKRTLGVPKERVFEPVAMNVSMEFVMEGDYIQRPYLLYTQLLADGIRVLHYLGKLDNIVGYTSTVSFLRRLPSQFREEFRGAPDLPWPTATSSEATVRAIGSGAGNQTLVLMTEAGHFVTKDQPALAKSIVERWVKNAPWFEDTASRMQAAAAGRNAGKARPRIQLPPVPI